MANQKLKPLDSNILKNKKFSIVSTQEALRDITPINWSQDVLSGKKKVTIDKSR